MKNINKEKIFLNKVTNKPLIIWGARMTGLGLQRFAYKNKLNIITVVDSDPSLQNKNIGNYRVEKTEVIEEYLKKFPELLVIVAAALKEDEIIKILTNKGVKKENILNFSEFCKTFFTIDIVGQCSLKCPSCAQSLSEIKVPMGIMRIDKFKEVIKKIKDQTDLLTHVALYSWGEPLLHKELDLIINHLHDQGVAAAVSSHLSIPSDEQIKKLVKAAPEYLKISTSGFYPDAYNSTHTGGDVNLVKSNMYKIKYYMENFKSKIYVDVNYHLYKNNIGADLDMMKKLCDELGFGLSMTYPVIFPIERCIDYLEGKSSEDLKKLSKLMLVNIDEGLEITKPYRSLPCRYLSNQINLNWDCSVPLCCVTFDRNKNNSIISQNFLNDTLENIEKKKEKHSLCEKCSSHGIPPYQLGIDFKAWEQIAKKNSN